MLKRSFQGIKWEVKRVSTAILRNVDFFTAILDLCRSVFMLSVIKISMIIKINEPPFFLSFCLLTISKSPMKTRAKILNYQTTETIRRSSWIRNTIKEEEAENYNSLNEFDMNTVSIKQEGKTSTK